MLKYLLLCNVQAQVKMRKIDKIKMTFSVKGSEVLLLTWSLMLEHLIMKLFQMYARFLR